MVLGLLLSVALACPPGNDLPFRIVPAFRQGRVVGFKLWALRPPLFDAGLRNGDVVTRVAGCEPLTRPEQVLACAAQVQHADRVVLTVERQGVPLEVVVPLPGPASVVATGEPWALAGVLLDDAPERRAAVLVHRETGRHVTVREGEALGSLRVEHIAEGRVLVSTAHGPEVVLPRPGARSWTERRGR